ncbi:hypothetical protein KAFR_0E00960 [Kazachstania africana CBS 2517]|uniref:Geranylgeranyl pyrophosphate synthase n=1 Tax=Kazachstania africana (strain ATCC 22294 / BCRC 22015 / CBS 2517 / CECT 1963 / NBRC 1671 / NRRL Y-8276) TaxID=1071382 RepID=H2AV50_KAZAF|nr:hypothetical protein KAFR_0E00960 [Kazachstania africana CBS 2517]CCF58250.1 hypothetical protein KAFR_0E00960 [Kazachstania africana CBS 2517]
MDTSKLKELINGEPYWCDSDESILQKPYTHLTQKQGKKFRLKLILILNKIFFHLPQDLVMNLNQIIEILHNSSLLIDDIEDNSILRRGLKASHVVFGSPMTINSANYMYFKAMEIIPLLIPSELDELDKPRLTSELYEIFNTELLNLHRGQGLDIYWRDHFIIPTEEMYFNMVINKTGGLFRLTVKLMAKVATYTKTQSNDENKSLVPLCNLLGVVYQVRDDYLNLLNDDMIVNKGFGEDITEGKLSFPVIHGLNYEKKINQDKMFLWNTLLSKTTDIELKVKFIEFLKNESKSMTYTKKTLQNLTNLIKIENYFLPTDTSHIDQDTINEFHYVIHYLSTV